MDETTVRHVATLARLKLSDAEIARMAQDLTRITDYITQLSRANVEAVTPTVHPVAAHDLWRADQVRPSLPRETATANAPESEQSFFKVLPVIE